MRVLITGGAGFVGSHVCERLIERGHEVVAIDNFDPFYDPAIKRENIAAIKQSSHFLLVEADIRNLTGIEGALAAAGMEVVDVIVHLAARAGVRPSIEEPILYSQVNVDGTVAMLELARRWDVGRFVFVSSSSVYGNNVKVPFAETDPVDFPISPYAASKRAGELLCHTYHHLFRMSTVCLRLFTVYGPRQRPDLAIHKFTQLMALGKEIPIFGDGTTERDYTYIDDIVQGIEGAIAYTGVHGGAFEIVNLGESETTSLRRLVTIIGATLGIEPLLHHLPPQAGDVDRTFADISKARRLLGYNPQVRVEEGIHKFVEWFKTVVR